MAYRSDRSIVQDLLPVLLFTSVILHGTEHEQEGDAKETLKLLNSARVDILDALDDKKRKSLLARCKRLHDDIINPYIEQQIHVAKFGLIVFYVFSRIRDAGELQIDEGSNLDQAMDSILSPEGTITAFANTEKVDESAQKQAAKVFALIRNEGYYGRVTW